MVTTSVIDDHACKKEKNSRRNSLEAFDTCHTVCDGLTSTDYLTEYGRNVEAVVLFLWNLLVINNYDQSNIKFSSYDRSGN
jgi:hypothetical protein